MAPIKGNGASTMTREAIAAAALAALLCAAPEAKATEAGKFQSLYGTALAPVGYVDFCHRNPSDCSKAGRDTHRIVMNEERWAAVRKINNYVNATIKPVSDQELYGQAEYWTYPVDAGDCEDFLLLKKRDLERLGFPAGALLITVVLDEKGEGHAILTVATDEGDFVLDNRRDAILRWSETHYRFLKRQSAEDPNHWVALAKTVPVTTATVKSSPLQGVAPN
jgi:predicted transglutaminase-like cysteine proteinase